MLLAAALWRRRRSLHVQERKHELARCGYGGVEGVL
jgi:hypothetical protein